MKNLPSIFTWIKAFFENRLDPATLMIYADWLEEQNYDQIAHLFRNIGKIWRDPKSKTGKWQEQLINPFYDLMNINGSEYYFNDRAINSLYVINDAGQMPLHIIRPNMTSYRLSITNGHWFHYTNTTRISNIVPVKHQDWYENVRIITFRDYSPIAIDNVPERLLLETFYNLLEKQVRGNH